jgi:predicted MPP superfamily phosphohydrolase
MKGLLKYFIIPIIISVIYIRCIGIFTGLQIITMSILLYLFLIMWFNKWKNRVIAMFLLSPSILIFINTLLIKFLNFICISNYKPILENKEVICKFYISHELFSNANMYLWEATTLTLYIIVLFIGLLLSNTK